MTDKKIVFFPDTNLFFECMALEEIDWALLGDFDQIDLIVTLPVQGEIDRHKKSSNNRTLRRARNTASMFREMLSSPDNTKIVRTGRPHVQIRLEAGHKPSKELGSGPIN